MHKPSDETEQYNEPETIVQNREPYGGGGEGEGGGDGGGGGGVVFMTDSRVAERKAN